MKEFIIKIHDKPDIMGGYSLIEKAKELIRCKDCKWNNGYTGCDKYLIPHGGDWFCADAEKAK